MRKQFPEYHTHNVTLAFVFEIKLRLPNHQLLQAIRKQKNLIKIKKKTLLICFLARLG